MIVSDVNFPETVLNALRNGNLVIFAGAGVSMGEPANLPSFAGLSEQIGLQAGISKLDGEGDDRFLGRLQDRGIQVHHITAQILTPLDLSPTKLHRNLLRLYTTVSNIRIVTTNFDRLFETAAGSSQLQPENLSRACLALGPKVPRHSSSPRFRYRPR